MSFPAEIQLQPTSGSLDLLSRLSGLLDRMEPRVRRRFLQSINAARDVRSLEEIAELLEEGRVAEALDITEQIGQALATAIEAAYTAAGLSAAQVLRANRTSILDFNQTNARAVGFLVRERARLIRELTRQQREATAEIVRDSIARGLAPVEQARRLRGSIGLTRRQARSVVNFRRLLEGGTIGLQQALQRQLRDRRFDPTLRRALRGDVELSPEQIDRMVERYQARYLAFRASTIARTESVRAIHAGDREMWQQAIDAGEIEPSDIVQVWVTARDERVRSSHAFMDGQTQPFGTAFTSGNGNQLRFPGDPNAPASDTINCRCVLARSLEPPSSDAAR